MTAADKRYRVNLYTLQNCHVVVVAFAAGRLVIELNDFEGNRIIRDSMYFTLSCFTFTFLSLNIFP